MTWATGIPWFIGAIFAVLAVINMRKTRGHLVEAAENNAVVWDALKQPEKAEECRAEAERLRRRWL